MDEKNGWSFFTLFWVTLLLGFLFPPLWLLTIICWFGFAFTEFDYKRDRI